MAVYHGGSAEVTIVPNARKFFRDLKKDLREQDVSYTVDVQPNVTALKARVREALSGVRARIAVDADLSLARERLMVFTKVPRTLDVRVNVNTGRAGAQLAAFQGASAPLDALTTSAHRSGEALAGIANPAKAAVIAVGALAALSLAPLIGQIAQATTALVAVTPAAGAAVTGLGAAVLVGSSGVVKAFQAAKAEAEQAEQSAKAQASAQRQLATAVEQAARTHEQGEKRIAAAKQASKDAEEALTRARKQAQEQIEDLNLAVTGGALDEEGARLAVERAQQRLSEVTAFGSGASGLDRREADLAYRQSIQRLHEVQKRNGDLREQLAESDQKGVEGSDAVTAAKRRQADAEAGLQDAITEAAQANKEAAQRVSEAQKEFSEGSAAVQEYRRALADLSPAARDFMGKIRGLGGAWKDLRKQVQDKLFSALGDSVVRLANTQLPVLRTGLSGIAEEINGGIRRGFEFLSTEAAKTDLTTIFDNTRVAVRFLVDGLGDLGAILWDVTTVGSKFLPRLGEGFENTTGSWREQIHKMREDGSLEKFIGDGLAKLKQILSVVKDFGRTLANIFKGSNKPGEDMLDSLRQKVKKLADWLGTAEGQQKVKDFFTYVKNALAGISTAIGKVTGFVLAMERAMDKVGGSPLAKALGNLFGDDKSGGERLLGALQFTTPGIIGTLGWDLVKDKVREAKEAIGDFVFASGEKLSSWGNTLSGWGDSVTGIWTRFTSGVSDGWANTIRPALERLKDEGLGGLANAMLDKISGGAVKNWRELPSAIGDGVTTLLDNVFPGFKDGLGKVRDFFREVVTTARGYWQELKEAVREPIAWVITTVINGGIGKAWQQVDHFLANKLPDWTDVVIPGMARGGLVPLEQGAEPGKDSVLRNLMPGEFVMSVPAVQAAGAANLAAFNAAALAGANPAPEGMFAMASGGLVTTDDPAWAMLKRGHDFAAAQDGKPYQWAGPRFQGDSFDCSGFMASIAAAILGKNPWQRYFATSSFTAAGGPMGFVPGLGAGFSVGVHDNPGGPGGGHMVGTLSGVEGLPNVNVESGGSGGVKYGGAATGAADSQFPWKFHLPVVDGAFIDPGPGGDGEGKRGWIARKAQDLFDRLVAPLADAIRTGVDSVLGTSNLKAVPGAVFESLCGAVRDEIGAKIDALTEGISGLYDTIRDTAEKANPLHWIPGIVRDQGGVLKPGASLVYNGTGADEWILNPEWAARIDEVVRLITGQHTGPVIPDYDPSQQALAAHQATAGPTPPQPDKWAELGQQSLSKVEQFAKENWQGVAESLFAGIVGAGPTTINAVDIDGAYREARRRENMRRARYRVPV
ncbi:hypothetical protein IU500_12440 [Nocardia terpenica]|uniref:hypothetical protein n=1 Tax=Nocardia terpenica TaxID=455432 RepID=UPI001894BD39|nr:hypothetical protein [Nocardia terpenica]MBF6063014.1 hypothetical protein [Nocardia terpenica]MBF6104851.1 hypothetical protein [Nocardia terpenica]MBF6112712.1 hypothetical protein [Nocardia terpenica]MBF6118579.1 hypothetical protein [Nocardia terpenica]MBF6155058.1 hypothetical protein [Nocardia terpenica]